MEFWSAGDHLEGKRLRTFRIPATAKRRDLFTTCLSRPSRPRQSQAADSSLGCAVVAEVTGEDLGGFKTLHLVA